MAADAIDIPLSLSMTAPVFLPCSCRPSHECGETAAGQHVSSTYPSSWWCLACRTRPRTGR